LSAIASDIAGRCGSILGLRGWWPVLTALAVLYVPMYVDIDQVIWREEPGTAGPILLAVVVWLMARERAILYTRAAHRNNGASAVGIGLLVVGLSCYVLGRSQMMLQLQFLSQIPVLFGLAVLLLNRQALRRLSFPILFLLFLVPIPGSVLDELLLPLKQWVSQCVVALLYHAGFPVARNGVVITIGRYELLIADACSGLNSMVALSGIGLLYVHLVGRRNPWLNGALLMSVLPIAFSANVVRVLALVLLTYYAGERTGSSFHHSAGYIEILVAFGCFFAFDHLLTQICSAHRIQSV
jgi:exosortase B